MILPLRRHLRTATGLWRGFAASAMKEVRFAFIGGRQLENAAMAETDTPDHFAQALPQFLGDMRRLFERSEVESSDQIRQRENA